MASPSMGTGAFWKVVTSVSGRPFGAMAACLLLLFSGCGDEGAGPLMVGTNVWSGYEPFYLAEAKGLISANDVRMVQLSSASEVIRAFRNRVIPVAAVTLDEALLMASEGLAVKVILAIDTSSGGDAILGKPNITRLEDLRGKKVGVEAGALGAFVLCRAAGLHNLDCKRDVTTVNLEANEHETAFRKGSVDAVVTFDPVRGRLRASGARLLFDSREIPDEIVDVLVVRSDAITAHRKQLEKLLRGWFAALAYMDTNPTDADTIMGRREDLDATQFQAALGGLHIPDRAENRTLLGGVHPRLAQTAPMLIDVMVQHGLLAAPLQVADLLAPELVEGLAP